MEAALSKNGLVAQTSALLRTSLFALAGFVVAGAATGCGDDNNGNIDASTVDARPIDAPIAPAVLTITPLTSDFGSVAIGSTGTTPQSFTVTNTAAGTSGQISAQIMGSAAANYAIESNTCTTLAQNATCTIKVSFSPVAPAGAKSATLSVTGAPGGTITSTLDGVAVPVGNILINPSSNAFADTVVGATSAASATFTVSNGGGTATGPLTVSVSGSNPNDFVKSADTCNGTAVAAAATCTVTVSFKPSSAGAKAASIIVAGTPGGSVTAAVTGTGISDALLALTPQLQDFGTVTNGSTSNLVTFTVTNTGGVASGAIAQTLGGADAGQFTVASGSCSGATLAPGATCSVALRFAPTASGAKAATLSFTATPGGTKTATLLGTGQTSGFIVINGGPFAFASTVVGQTSSSQTITVTNTGSAATGALITALGGNDPGQFTIVAGSNGCQGAVLAGGGSCTIAISFAPTSGGDKSASLTVSGSPGGVATAGLSGTGIPPAHFAISPTSHDFGAIGTGTQSGFFTFTVTNDGGQASGVPSVTLGGTNATQFILQNGCTAALAPAATCTAQVRFSPNIDGNDSATLVVSGTPGGTATANLFGQAVQPAALVASVGTINFDSGAGLGGVTLIGDTTMKTYTLTNTGTEPTGTITFTKSGANQADYTFTSNCTTLPASMSCTVTVSFSPTASGLETASLLATSTPGGSASVAFSGNALPRLQITAPNANPFAYPTAIVNTTAPTSTTVTFKNNQQSAKTVTTTIAGDTTNFNVVSNSCNASIGANGTCDVQIQFIPKDTAAHTLTVTGSVGPTAADKATETLTGTGVNSLTISASTTGQTVCTGSVPNITCDFGNIAQGTVSGQLTVTVSNPTGAPAANSISTTLSNTDFQVVSDGCAASGLAPNSSCQIILQFQPSGSTGAQAANLTVTANPAGGSATLALKASVVTGAALTFTPAAGLDFDTVFSGSTKDLTIRVANTGGAPSGVLTFTNGAGQYTLNPGAAVLGDCASGTTILGAGGSATDTCNVRVRFAPTGATTTTVAAAAGNVHFATAGNVGLGTLGHDTALTGKIVPSISLSATQDLGNVAIGSVTSKVFTVTNNSTASVTVTSAILSGAGAETTITSNTCSTIAAGGTCLVTVQFAPTASGNYDATLTVNSPNGIAATHLVAHVNTVASLAWSPASADLGSALAASSTGGSATFTLKNSGEQPGNIAVTQTDATDFTLTTTCGATLAGGATCTASVKFTPPAGAAAGVRTTTIQAAAGVTTTATGTVNTTGSLLLTPPQAAFPSTTVGQVSAGQAFTVQNSGTTTVSVNPTLTGPFAQTNTCGIGLIAGAQCTVTVTYNPTAPGAATGTLTVTGGAYSALTGNGIGPAVLAYSFSTDGTNFVAYPAAFNFGSVATDSSVTVIFRATNTGGLTSAAVAAAISGNDPGSYVATNGCTAGLAAGAHCDVTVKFAPQGVGNKTASLQLTSTTNSPGAVALSGVGVLEAILGITPSVAQTAGSAPVGNVATPENDFTIRNGGDVDLSTGGLVITLSNSTDFVLDTTPANACAQGQILAANATCHVYVQFAPKTVGNNLTTTLTVKSAAGSGTTTVTNTISGNGTPTVTPSQASHTFGTVQVSHAGAAFTFTFTNNGLAPTGFLHTVLGGTNPGEFSILTDNCSGKTVTAPGSCTITANFTPQTTGAKSATITVQGAPGNAVVSLTGTSN